MIERLVITLLLLVGGWLAYLGVQWWQRRSIRVEPAGQPTLLYFRSDRCAGCFGQKRVLEQLQDAHGARFDLRQVDTDREPDVAAAYRVMTLPTTIFATADGAIQHINYGVTSYQKLARQLEKVT